VGNKQTYCRVISQNIRTTAATRYFLGRHFHFLAFSKPSEASAILRAETSCHVEDPGIPLRQKKYVNFISILQFLCFALAAKERLDLHYENKQPATLSHLPALRSA